MLLALVENVLRRAEPRLGGQCPGCTQPVVAKCGEILIWHWAHLPNGLAACDQWTEPETEWHLAWKERAIDAGCQVEVTMRDGNDWHRADIVRPDGVVVEVQHSSLGIGEADEREAFYRKHGGLIWIWDATERYWNSIVHDPWAGGYMWESPSQTIASLRAPLYFDTPDGLWRISEMKNHWNTLRFDAELIESSDEIFQPILSDVLPTSVAAARLPAALAWTVLPERCASCGAKPVSTFRDGSPKYGCHISDPERHQPKVVA